MANAICDSWLVEVLKMEVCLLILKSLDNCFCDMCMGVEE